MLESDARKKWCPMSRVQGGMGTYNRPMADEVQRAAAQDHTLCLGSACMMWEPTKPGSGDCELKRRS